MLKVLIADDEEKICQLIEKLIDWQALDMTLSGVANNGIEALEKIEALSPDVVITDIRMPGYDGLDLVKKDPGTECRHGICDHQRIPPF
uniref:response regulator n=1 Tax=Clostridium sp. NkU-1 TaxID=1095009 RepID=UPI000AD42E54